MVESVVDERVGGVVKLVEKVAAVDVVGKALGACCGVVFVSSVGRAKGLLLLVVLRVGAAPTPGDCCVETTCPVVVAFSMEVVTAVLAVGTVGARLSSSCQPALLIMLISASASARKSGVW